MQAQARARTTQIVLIGADRDYRIDPLSTCHSRP
jgi:hypothetical protein